MRLMISASGKESRVGERAGRSFFVGVCGKVAFEQRPESCEEPAVQVSGEGETAVQRS